MKKEDLNLLHGYFNDTLEESEFGQLQTLLRSSSEARRVLRSLATVEARLHQFGATNPATMQLLAPPASSSPASIRWLTRRPAAAVAAGLLIGLCGASMLFAYIAPTIPKPITLLEAGFENVTPPKALGVPDRSGEWGGDYAEIVGAQNGVTPRSGAKMWRFLKANNALEPDSSPSYVGEAIYVLSLNSVRNAEAKAAQKIEISAWFAQGNTHPNPSHHWNIKAAAFEGSVTDAPKLWGKWNDTSASLVRHETTALPGPDWQPLSVTLAIPAKADFLVFECAVVHRKPLAPKGGAAFPAHYLDDVRVRLLPSTHDSHP
jgi:hypothetical protein